MRRAWIHRGVVSWSALVLGMLVVSFTSCATNSEDGQTEYDASSPIPAPDADGDAAADSLRSPCDASVVDCTTVIAACETVAWCMAPAPISPRHALTSAWGSSANDVWAVGSGGTILHYDGQEWKATPSGFPNTLFGVWGSGPNDVWVVSSTELVLRSTGFANGTAVWRNEAPVERATSYVGGGGIYTIWGSGPDDVRLGTTRFFTAVTVPGQPYFAYIGASNQLLKSTAKDGGSLWRTLPGSEYVVTNIWGSSATDVWMTIDNTINVPSERGMILHGTPYEGPRPNPRAVYDGSTCNDCYSGCIVCGILDDPLSWKPVDSQSSARLESVWGSSAQDVWAVGERGAVRRYRTGDERWQIIDSPTTATLRRVWGSGPDDIWMIGDNGTILHYDGASVAPSSVQLPLGPRPNLYGIWGSGPDDVWIVGEGIVLHYTGPKGAP